MKKFKLVWDGMNGLTYTVKADNLKEAKTFLIERIDSYEPIYFDEIQCVGSERIVESVAA